MVSIAVHPLMVSLSNHELATIVLAWNGVAPWLASAYPPLASPGRPASSGCLGSRQYLFMRP